MATYEQLKRDPNCRRLFSRRTTTLEGLQAVLEDNASLIALDTKHRPVESERDHALYQVGLAYLPTLLAPYMPPLIISSCPRLDRFMMGAENRRLLLAGETLILTPIEENDEKRSTQRGKRGDD
ncbi:hypothetical protein GGR51DRAFT_567330 [Nemania sp. FL0031]|nr:hypothetical protein GGR51DRAFT_567330 [Nemania sp. FL0031]